MLENLSPYAISGKTIPTTPAVQYWYYPGETIGKEFVYPKDQALKIAARTGSTVLSTEGEITAQSSVSSVDAEGKVTPWERQPRAQSAPAEAQASPAPTPAQPTISTNAIWSTVREGFSGA